VTLETAFQQRFGSSLIVAHDGPQETVRRYASGLVAQDGRTPPIAFAGEDFLRGGVAILTPEEATAALDQAACIADKKPPRAA
jgi:hypothetical protein